MLTLELTKSEEIILKKGSSMSKEIQEKLTNKIGNFLFQHLKNYSFETRELRKERVLKITEHLKNKDNEDVFYQEIQKINKLVFDSFSSLLLYYNKQKDLVLLKNIMAIISKELIETMFIKVQYSNIYKECLELKKERDFYKKIIKDSQQNLNQKFVQSFENN